MTPVRKAALRLEMAEGRLQALLQSENVDDVAAHVLAVEEAILSRDHERGAFRLTLEREAGLDAHSIARMLAL